MDIIINKKNIFSRFSTGSSGCSIGGSLTPPDLSGYVTKWEDWGDNLNVSGITTSTNFVFTGVDGSGGGTGGTTVTGISFSGRTLTLSQDNLSDLTATFTLVSNDIPQLAISKIDGLQSALDSKLSSISLTTTGSSGASTLIGSTLNIPNYTLTGLGGVPTTRTLTINGTSFDLSANRSWSVGTVTSVGGNNGITGTVTTTGNLGLTGQALALHNLATNGLIARTGIGTVAARTLTAGNGITITNGNGVSGNPTIEFNTTFGDGRYVDLINNQTVAGLKTFSNYVQSTNFVFSGVDGSGGSSGGGTTVTGISFNGRTLTLSQDNLTDLTATFSLVSNDIPNLDAGKITTGTFNVARIPSLAISKITGLQSALDTKVDLAGARASISLTTTGSSGASTYSSSTGVLNIPNLMPLS